MPSNLRALPQDPVPMRAFDTVEMLALQALLTIFERQQWSEWEFTIAAVSRLRGPV